MTDILPVALDAGVDRLLVHEGVPVWPAATPSDLAVIEQAAALAGLQVQRVSATLAEEPQGSGLVAGVGPATRAIARLYAHLTGRRVQHADDVEFAIARNPAVLVVMECELTVAVFDLLSQRATEGRVIGVITGHDPESLRVQALIRSIATRASAPAPASKISLLSMLERPSYAEEADGIVDPRADGRTIRDALGRGAGVLTILSHGDGIDTNLNSLVLCPMDRVPANPDLQRLPRCQERGTCHRGGGIPIDQWLASPKHVAPEAVAARLLLYASCWGVLPASSYNDNAWSLGRRLLCNPRIGAIVTSWEVQLYESADLLAFARSVAAGAQLGAAVEQLLTTPSARRADLRMCLFGDPSIRQSPVIEHPVAVAPRTAAGDRVAEAPAPPPKLEGQATAELAFLRHYMSLVAPSLTDPTPIRDALAAIARYELAGVRGSLASYERDTRERWRERVLDAALWSGPLTYHTWLPLARGITASSRVTCSHCRERVIVRYFPLCIPDVPPRRLATCVHCGVIADSTSPRSIEIAIRDGVIHLAANVPRDAWAGRIAVYTRDVDGPAIAREWPAGADGWPARSAPMPVPDGAPSDAVSVAVFLLHGVSLHIARVPVRYRTRSTS